MEAVVGRTWGWVRSLGSCISEDAKLEGQKNKGDAWVSLGWTSWIWRGWKHQSDLSREEYWEVEEKFQPMEIRELGAGKEETDANTGQVSRWWKYVPTALFWSRKTESSELGRRKHDLHCGGVWEDGDVERDFSDYGTPPPSPTPPSSLRSPFRLFAHSWTVEILPEHHEICFNFLRHLFDLFVIGFLWTVSPPAKLIFEAFGVQGVLRLWLHGMAMFFVSTVGMAGLLWLIQEYLPQFALIYGIIQALVIGVSVQQNAILNLEEQKQERDVDNDKTAGVKDTKEQQATRPACVS